MADTPIQPAVEFQALPLELVIATPLTAAVKAQYAAAQATQAFINGFIDQKTSQPYTIDLSVESTSTPAGGGAGGGGGSAKTVIRAPLLAMIPVPHLRIDSLTVNFKYEVSQTLVSKDDMRKEFAFDAQTGAALSPWVKASLRGSLASTSSEQNTVNRSGSLDITVRASEAEMPDGLRRFLAVLSRGLPSAETP
jgi:hypothetical protein